MISDNCGLSAADIAAVMNNNGSRSNDSGNDGMFGNNGAWWIIILFLFAFAGGWGRNANNGSGGETNMLPYLIGNQGSTADIQRGFDQQAVINGLGQVSAGVNALSPQLCNGFAGVTQAVTSGFSAAEIAAGNRQTANLQQQFNTQTAITAQLNAINNAINTCCCDTKEQIANLGTTIVMEDCNTRAAISNGIRDIIENNTSNTQTLINTTTSAVQGLMDKICQLELNAKDDRINQLQTQVLLSQIYSSQTAQTSEINANNAAQTAALIQAITQNGTTGSCGCSSRINNCLNNQCCGN